MRFDVLTLFPDLINSHLDFSIMKRAKEEQIIEINTINPRDFASNKHKKVDDTPYGGGVGMVLMPQPYIDAYESIKKLKKSITIMMTPQGKPFSQSISKELTQFEQIIIMCGHYEGYDERIREIINPLEISIGDFILTGGELPALCLIDSISRNIEGTLGKIESAHDDSFSDGLLEYPQYTKPRNFRGYHVPEVLLNGNHKLIEEFRLNQKIERTKNKRPDLYKIWLDKQN